MVYSRSAFLINLLLVCESAVVQEMLIQYYAVLTGI